MYGPPCESPRCRRDDTGRPDPRTAAPGLRLCWRCRDITAEQLAELPDLWRALEAALGVSVARFERVAGSRTPGVPLNEAAADARQRIRGVLREWCALLVDERGTQPPVRTVAGLTGYLTRHLDWLAAHPAAADFADEIAELTHAGRRAAYPNSARRITIGGCVVDACAGVLTAIVRDRDALLPSQIVCDVDGEHVWAADQWLMLGRRLRHAEAT